MDFYTYIITISSLVIAIHTIYDIYDVLSTQNQKKSKNNEQIIKNQNFENPNALYVVKMKLDEFTGINTLNNFLVNYLKIAYYILVLMYIILTIFVGYIFITMDVPLEHALIFIMCLIVAYSVTYSIKTTASTIKNRTYDEITINILKEGIQYYSKVLNENVLMEWEYFKGYKLKNNQIELHVDLSILSNLAILGFRYYLKYDMKLENIIKTHLREL
jgi:hypothetical protein